MKSTEEKHNESIRAKIEDLEFEKRESNYSSEVIEHINIEIDYWYSMLTN